MGLLYAYVASGVLHAWGAARKGRGAYVRSWMCEERKLNEEFIGSLVCDV